MRLFFSTLSLAVSTSAVLATDEPLELKLLAEKFETSMEAADEPRKRLDASYEKRLQELKTNVSSSGDLEKTLIVQSEIDNYRKRDRPKIPLSVPELRTARQKYEGALRRIEKTEGIQKREVLLGYERRLRSMVAEFTRARKFAEAVAARERLKAIEDDLLALKTATKPDAGVGSGTEKMLQVRTIRGCQMKSTEEGYLLTGVPKDKAYMHTVKEFTVPLVIKTRVKTDSTNIRLYFAKGMIILNWEMRRDELRVHDPATGKQRGFRGKGKVSAKEFHDIEWAILRDSMIFKVDDEIVYQNSDKQYRNLRSHVGIGPAHGSQLVVNKLSIDKPE